MQNPLPFMVAIVLAAGVLVSETVATAESPSAGEQFFEAEVRPLLIANCYECHSASLQESDLRLDSRSAILSGGISGPAAVERDIDASAILRAVRGDGDLERMPPDEPLSDEQIAVLEKWVQLGLPWTDDATPPSIALGDQQAIRAAAETHWAFQSITHPSPPIVDVSLEDHVANPIDAFIIDRLRQSKLSPSDPADRRTLIRRIHFDLVGLPPSMKRVAAFVNDKRPTHVIIEELVDELLVSEKYGERWARYWLDLARYADTQDWQAQADVRYPFAYTYRDYVITSLNADKPYDEFLREQIAADFYHESESAPQLAALGLLTVGPRFRNDRLEMAADQIDVVCRGLMGITVSCARCHDHKYDPVPIEDYYSLYGVLASTQIPESFPMIDTGSIDPKLLADYESQREEKERQLLNYKVELRQEAIDDLRKRLPVYLDGFAQMSIEKKSEIRGLVSKLKLKEIAMTPLDKSLAKRLQTKSDIKDSVLKPWAIGLSANEASYKQNWKKWLSEWSQDETIDPLVRARLEQDQPKHRSDLVASYSKVFAESLAVWDTYKATNPEATSLAGTPDAKHEPLRARLLEQGGWFDLDVEEVATASRLLGKGRKILGDLQKEIGEVESAHPGSPPRAMALVDLKKPISPFVMLRGEAQRRGDVVPRQFLSLLSGDERKPFRDGSGRRELAEAITDPSNPLTSRVLVNRVWAKYFARGLVESLDDFGLRSDPPSHPELLDWLSSEFLAHGQSLKWLHKTIVLSQTYQQSSNPNETASGVDPENRLLWRQNRRRLDFESMRDSMLVVSGTLDPTIGGRSVRLSEEPMTMRRSLYAYIDRVEMDPMLRTFDFASPTASAASRAETTIPQQALFSMNHPFVAAQAQTLADACDEGDEPTKIQALYRRIFQRSARTAELNVASEFLSQARPGDGDSASVWQYGYGPIELMGHADYELPPFPHWSGKAYQGSDIFPDPTLKFLQQNASGGHPGHKESLGTVRRWIAPAAGTVQVSGTVIHTREKSDGVIALVCSGDLMKSWTVVRSEVETEIPSINVQAGDVIDFVVSPGKSPSADTYTWDLILTGTEGGLSGQTWDSKSEFHGPLPPPLSPLAQLAQALLLTNEFLYLD